MTNEIIVNGKKKTHTHIRENLINSETPKCQVNILSYTPRGEYDKIYIYILVYIHTPNTKYTIK